MDASNEMEELRERITLRLKDILCGYIDYPMLNEDIYSEHPITGETFKLYTSRTLVGLNTDRSSEDNYWIRRSLNLRLGVSEKEFDYFFLVNLEQLRTTTQETIGLPFSGQYFKVELHKFVDLVLEHGDVDHDGTF